MLHFMDKKQSNLILYIIVFLHCKTIIYRGRLELKTLIPNLKGNN